jgi:hypothetical protein
MAAQLRNPADSESWANRGAGGRTAVSARSIRIRRIAKPLFDGRSLSKARDAAKENSPAWFAGSHFCRRNPQNLQVSVNSVHYRSLRRGLS